MRIDPVLCSQISWSQVYFYRKAVVDMREIVINPVCRKTEELGQEEVGSGEADRSADDWWLMPEHSYLSSDYGLRSILMWHLTLNWFHDDTVAMLQYTATHHRSNYRWQTKWDKSESSLLSSNAMWNHIYVTELSTMNTTVTIIIIIAWYVWK